ncbi:hypothetical protein IC582_000637 [Cucumis melo]
MVEYLFCLLLYAIIFSLDWHCLFLFLFLSFPFLQMGNKVLNAILVYFFSFSLLLSYKSCIYFLIPSPKIGILNRFSFASVYLNMKLSSMLFHYHFAMLFVKFNSVLVASKFNSLHLNSPKK